MKKFSLFLTLFAIVSMLTYGPAAAQESSASAPMIYDFSSSGAASGVGGASLLSADPSLLMRQNSGQSPIVNRSNLLATSRQETAVDDGQVKTFGSQLFQRPNLTDRGIGVDGNYTISPGDRIAIKVWGARNFEDVQSVDTQGYIFLPEVGAIKVGGVQNRDLATVVSRYVGRIFTSNVNVYTNLLGTQPIKVFVTGAVMSPGAYPGSQDDGILYYLARAGAISPDSGSYRDIRVVRDGKIIDKVDLYDFLLNGVMPKISFRQNDTIIVGPQKTTVVVEGSVKNNYRFEINSEELKAAHVLDLAGLSQNASHGHIQGVRDGKAYTAYISIDEIGNVSLRGGDTITIIEDYAQNNLTIRVSGNSGGTSSLIVPPGTDLNAALRLIEVNPNRSDINSIYLRRVSVAERQKEALDNSLYELQKAVLTAAPSTSTEAAIRAQEATLIERFVAKVSNVEPEGRVVLGDSSRENIQLEDGDEIVIPELTDVVVISGEVKVPLTLAWQKTYDWDDYLDSAGGLSRRGDIDNILVMKRNGSVHNGDKPIAKGDHIVVLPRQDGKSFAMFKEVIEILYRVAVSAGVVINAMD